MPETGASGENNPMSPSNIATAMTMFKKLGGSDTFPTGSANKKVIDSLLKKEPKTAQEDNSKNWE